MKILEMEEVDEQDGTWEPFAKIVVEEGGDKSAFTAAENYCSQCFELHSKGETFHKRPWVLYNDFTKRVEMLYIKKKFRSANRELWRLSKEASKGVADRDKGGDNARKNAGDKAGDNAGAQVDGGRGDKAGDNDGDNAGARSNLSSCMK